MTTGCDFSCRFHQRPSIPGRNHGMRNPEVALMRSRERGLGASRRGGLRLFSVSFIPAGTSPPEPPGEGGFSLFRPYSPAPARRLVAPLALPPCRCCHPGCFDHSRMYQKTPNFRCNLRQYRLTRIASVNRGFKACPHKAVCA